MTRQTKTEYLVEVQIGNNPKWQLDSSHLTEQEANDEIKLWLSKVATASRKIKSTVTTVTTIKRRVIK